MITIANMIGVQVRQFLAIFSCQSTGLILGAAKGIENTLQEQFFALHKNILMYIRARN